MAQIYQTVTNGLRVFLDEYGHPKTKDFPLVNSPVPMLAIVGCWLCFCLRCGPRFMKDRQPYELKNTLLVYNFLQICLSVYVFYMGGVYGWFTRYNFNCQPVDWSDNPDPEEFKVFDLVWLYYISKLTELLDTVFFVLRKKNNQISSLHIYHHTIMPIFGWIAVKFAPGGHGTLVGWINTFVHIIMYTYYFISGLGPQYQKYLWWKRHLTLLQLIQFVIIFYHNFSVLFRECAYPRYFNIAATVESIVFIYMFGNFYYKSYVKESSRKRE